MTSTHHQIPQQPRNGGAGRIEDQWEGTRGVLPESLDDRDQFITKFNTALAIAKAKAAGNVEEWTARLNVAELELVFNVFTESQYRGFSKQRGDVALFYTLPASLPTPSSNLNPGLNGTVAKGHGQHLQQNSQIVDLMSFKRLPLHVGLIQSSSKTAQATTSNVVVSAAAPTAGGTVRGSEEICHEDGFRLVLKSKADLNGSGSTEAASEEANQFLDVDAFQIHLTDLGTSVVLAVCFCSNRRLIIDITFFFNSCQLALDNFQFRSISKCTTPFQQALHGWPRPIPLEHRICFFPDELCSRKRSRGSQVAS